MVRVCSFTLPCEAPSQIVSIYLRLSRSLACVLPSGLRIKECSVHERDGKRWVGLPGKPWKKMGRLHRLRPDTGFRN